VWGAARNPDVFSNTMGVGYGRLKLEGDHPSITNMDRPHHTMARHIVSGFFTPRAVQEQRKYADELMDRSLDNVAGKGVVNFADEVSWPLIGYTVGRLMKFPEADLPMIRWNTDSSAMAGQAREGSVLPWVYQDPEEARRMSPDEMAEAQLQLMSDDQGGYPNFAMYFAERVMRHDAEHAAGKVDADHPGVFTDLLYKTGKEGYELTFTEKIAFEGLMAVGGNETTTQQLSGSALLLAERPDVLQRVREDPSIVPAVVEELLRYVSAVTGLFRNTLSEVDVGGTTIPADEKVLLLYGSANHDPDHYKDADEFVIDRFPRGMADADHLAFTTGVHVCLGANLARVLLGAFVEKLAQRVERLELAGPVHRGTNALVRVIEDLPMEVIPLR
jgi:cytochrome P450